MFKEIWIEQVGFIIEVNSFFFSGVLYAKHLYLYCFPLLGFSFIIALYVGNLIYKRGTKILINKS